MNLSVQAKYFWIAIVCVGSIGIWLPFLLAIPLKQTVDVNTIAINLTTFYVSIYFSGCIDFMLKQIDNIEHSNTKSKLLNIIFLILLFIALIISTIWLSVLKYVTLPIILSGIGSVIALRLWWITNSDNPTFDEFMRKEAKNNHTKNW
jgi:uncharacterized protein YacL